MNEFARIVFLFYFITHIPITLIVDAQALFGTYYPASLQSLVSWYTTTLNDRLFIAKPVWFKSFIIAELLFQLHSR